MTDNPVRRSGPHKPYKLYILVHRHSVTGQQSITLNLHGVRIVANDTVYMNYRLPKLSQRSKLFATGLLMLIYQSTRPALLILVGLDIHS